MSYNNTATWIKIKSAFSLCSRSFIKSHETEFRICNEIFKSIHVHNPQLSDLERIPHRIFYEGLFTLFQIISRLPFHDPQSMKKHRRKYGLENELEFDWQKVCREIREIRLMSFHFKKHMLMKKHFILRDINSFRAVFQTYFSPEKIVSTGWSTENRKSDSIWKSNLLNINV